MNTQDFTIQEEQLPLILSLLDESQLFPIQPQGCSMFPFFMGNRDTLYIKKPVFPLKRGDIALYRRKNGTYVVHRVHHTKEAAPSRHSLQYYMLGDHQTWIEGPIEEDQIYGYVTAYERKGKKIDCASNRKYNLLWRIWMRLRIARPFFCSIWNFIHKHS